MLLHTLMLIIIFCPIVFLLIGIVIAKVKKIEVVRAFGYAADLTTLFLFFAIPLLIQFIWDIKTGLYIFILAIIGAIVCTIIDWKTKKEILIKPLLKRIWRIYFIVLMSLYALIWLVGLVHYVLEFMDIL